MTILHVICPQREGAIGGSDLHVIDLATVQRNDGHQTLVLAPRASSEYRERLAAADLDSFTRLLTRPFALLRLPDDQQVGIIHAHGYEATYLVAALRTISAAWRQRPTVVTAHGWIETTPWLRLKSALDRLSARTAHVRITSAAAHASGFRRHRSSTLPIHNGIPRPDAVRLSRLQSDRDRLRHELGVPPHSFLAGSLGRLSTEKRIDVLLTAAAGLMAARPDLHLLIIGGGGERGRLEMLAHQLGIRSKVTFTGLVRDPTSALAVLDVLIQPSDTEGTPRSILEAMAHGVPVIATDVGDVRKMLSDAYSGVLVKPGNAHQLAAAIDHLASEPDTRIKLAERAHRRYQERYTIEVMGRHVAHAYELARQAHARP